MAMTPAKSKRPDKQPEAAIQSRKLKQPAYRSFRLHKRIKGERLPGAFRVFGAALQMLGRHWKVFLGIVFIYGVLNMVFVQSFHAATGLDEAKSSFDQVFTDSWGPLASGFTVFAYLLGSSGNTVSSTAGAYQLILTLIVSLALIWTLRQLHTGHEVKVRDGFYRGMSPLVQFVLVLIVVALQLIPAAVGLLLYETVVSGNIASTGLEQVLWALLTFGLAVLSLYMISSSLFALYIVTLPGLTPLRALRSARQLVANRRWAVMRKVLFLPLATVVLAGALMVPLIVLVTPVAAWVFFALTMLLIPVVHSYMYTLYRAML